MLFHLKRRRYVCLISCATVVDAYPFFGCILHSISKKLLAWPISVVMPMVVMILTIVNVSIVNLVACAACRVGFIMIAVIMPMSSIASRKRGHEMVNPLALSSYRFPRRNRYLIACKSLAAPLQHSDPPQSTSVSCPSREKSKQEAPYPR